jgi:NAD(P)-dependent dehydrogenase (short-subunit alcohol dehydrogenase family)
MTSTNERIAIMGAAGGIGTALCRRLASRGARLHLAGRTEGPLEALGRELDAPWTVVDATDHDAVGGWLESVSTEGPLTGAVNLAGSILLKSAHGTSVAELEATIAQNLKSAFYVLKHAALAMKGSGSIVLLSSAAARIGMMNHEAIAAAKAGVEGLARAAAATYAPRNVRVNAVAPGLVETPLASKLLASEATRKASMALHPLRRVGRADDVASMIAWLLDPANDWVTGQVMGIDGGLGTVRPPPQAPSRE